MDGEFCDTLIPQRICEIEYSPPEDMRINFKYDAQMYAIKIYITSKGVSHQYLGRGRIELDDGYVRYLKLSAIDPFLIEQSYIPPKNIKIFLKAIYPKLLRDKLPVSCAVTFHEQPIVNITIFEVTDSAVRYYVHWLKNRDAASDIVGMDGYIIVENSIYKGSVNLVNMIPNAQNGAYCLENEAAKRFGRLCDIAGYMFCGEELAELRILGRGLQPPKHEFIISPFECTQPEKPKEIKPLGVRHIVREYDGPTLVSIRVSGRQSETNNLGLAFSQDAPIFALQTGEECRYVPFNGYWPTYVTMNASQKKYYLYFRTSFMNHKEVKTDLSYIFIAIYELINCGFKASEENFHLLMRYWTEYREQYPRLNMYMPRWAIDYIITNDLPIRLDEVAFSLPRTTVGYTDIIDVVLNETLKEGLWAVPLEMLFNFCDYDITVSRFYQSENYELLKAAIHDVLKRLDEFYAKTFGKRMIEYYLPPLTRRSYTSYCGAVCSGQFHQNLKFEFYPLSKSARLRKLLEVCIKYTENCLRIRKKFMGRLRVTGLPDDIKAQIDDVLAITVDKIPPKTPPIPIKIDICRAMELERDSWDNTRALLETIEQEEICEPEEVCDQEEAADTSESFLMQLTALERTFLFGILDGENTQEELCLAEFTMPDAVQDTINEKATDYFGDIILENMQIIEDYRDFLTTQREEIQ